MNLFRAFSGSAVLRRAVPVFLVAALSLGGGSARAQCSKVSEPLNFEPNPPGARRPPSLNWIGITDFRVYQPAGLGPRLLVSESFGYQVVDLTNPANPTALGYEDYRFSPTNPGPIPCGGDCHGTISSQAMSEDGQRVLFGLLSTNSAQPPLSTVVGQPNQTGWGFQLTGDMLPNNSTVALQKVGGRYLAYATDGVNLYVADVTSPGGLSGSDSLHSERTAFQGGYQLIVAGNNLVYRTGTSLQVIDVSNPGPVGSISGNFHRTTVSVADWHRSGESPVFFTAAVEPGDSSKLYVLATFADAHGANAGYSLMLIQGGQKTDLGVFRIPVQQGETWGSVASSGLLASDGNLFALMWARRDTPAGLFRLYSVPVSAWGAQEPAPFDVTTTSFSVTGAVQGVTGTNGTLYTYTAGGTSGWMLPMTCVSTNSPAVSGLSATSYGSSLPSGATVFLGDEVDIATTVNPPPASQPLTGFGWNFDFDFHAGVATEDNGGSASPRLHAPDNATLGSPSTPPGLITVVGPCDPQVAGTHPSNGAGCWASVTGNAAFAGGTADFTGQEVAGDWKLLTIALEANNQYGSGGIATFGLKWTVPAAKLQSTQVLSAQPLVSGSDGHPIAAGFKWYFGDSPTALVQAPGCTGSSCVPTFDTKGQHYYWLTATYANGYATPDYAGTSAMGTYSVTDFAPAFTVNGSATGPITAITGSQLSVVNSSQYGGGITGSYLYNLCLSPCGADNYVPWSAMHDPPTSGSPGPPIPIQVSSVPGTYLLKIMVNYTGGTTYWPDPNNVGTFTVNVTDVIPEIRFNCVPGFACQGIGSLSVNTGDQISAWVYISGGKDPNPPAGLSWTMPGASPSSCVGASCQPAVFSYGSAGVYTVTMSGYGSPLPATVTVTQHVTPVSVSAFANPSSTTVGTNVFFSCSATGGSGSYTSYSWTITDGANSGNASFSHAFQSAGNYTATCTVRDSQGHQGQGSRGVTVTSGGGGSCGVSNLFHTTSGIYPDSPVVGGGFSIPWGAPVTFVANNGYSSYTWDFGDGQFGSGQSATHTYPQASFGNRTVSLTVDGCRKSYSIVITGPAGPVVDCGGANFQIQGATYQSGGAGAGGGAPTGWLAGAGASLNFVATPPNSTTTGTTVQSYDWTWGDNTANGSGASASHAYAAAGTYTAILSMSTANPVGVCTTTYNVIVSGPSGGFSIEYEGDHTILAPTNVTAYKNVVFTASDLPSQVDSYSWDFGDGTPVGSGSTATHAFTPGSWTVTLTVAKDSARVSTTLALTVLAPPEPPKWFVAGMAYLKGSLAGTLWQTDMTVFNPDPSRPGTYSLAFLDGQHPVDPANLAWKPINLGARQSMSTPNILAYFEQPLGSFGALLVRGDSAPVPPVLTARTFNTGDPTKGTFGLSVPSTQSSSGLTPQAALARQFLIGLRDDDTAYTNVGLMNVTTDWSHARLTFLDGRGDTTFGQVNVDVPPYGVVQLYRPLAAPPPNGVGFTGPVDTFTVKVTVLSGGALFPYATVTDLRSTNSIVVTSSDQPSPTYRMPGIIRLQGANNTAWRSRFYITNPSTTSRQATISYSFVPCDGDGCKHRVTGLQSDVTLLPGETLWADDFTKVWLSFFGFDVSDTTAYQSSYVDVFPAAGDPNQEPLLVLGETYNDQPTGPVGLQVPGFIDADAVTRTGAYKRLVLAGLVSNTSYRTNVALFLQSGTSGRCTVHVLSATGEELSHQDIGFGHETTFVQLNDSGLFGSLPGNKDRLSVVIDSFDGSPISAYATVVDNTSGNATFLKAQPAP